MLAPRLADPALQSSVPHPLAGIAPGSARRCATCSPQVGKSRRLRVLSPTAPPRSARRGLWPATTGPLQVVAPLPLSLVVARERPHGAEREDAVAPMAHERAPSSTGPDFDPGPREVG